MTSQNKHILTWWQYGPKHPETKKSVDHVNRVHAGFGKLYPGHFSFPLDYTYSLGVMMAGGHIFQRKLGLPGYSQQLKLAAYKLWTEMVPAFTSEGGKPLLLDDWRKDFDAVLKWMAEYESRLWTYHDEGRATCEAAISQFAELNFPKPLYGFARAMVLTLFPEHIVKTFRLERPNFVVRWVVRRFFRTMMFLGNHVFADPETTVWERLYASSDKAGTVFEGVGPS